MTSSCWRGQTRQRCDYARRALSPTIFHTDRRRVTCRRLVSALPERGADRVPRQEFTADLRSGPVKSASSRARAQDPQFPEDAGPLAHRAARLQSKIKQLYTAHVMRRALSSAACCRPFFGRDGFRKGSRLFERRGESGDGRGFRLGDGRRLWPRPRKLCAVQQAGTPELACSLDYERAQSRPSSLSIRWCRPRLAGRKEAMRIPLKLGLLGPTATTPLLPCRRDAS